MENTGSKSILPSSTQKEEVIFLLKPIIFSPVLSLSLSLPLPPLSLSPAAAEILPESSPELAVEDAESSIEFAREYAGAQSDAGDQTSPVLMISEIFAYEFMIWVLILFQNARQKQRIF